SLPTCPRSEKLDRVAIGLRPLAITLQCLVEPPSQVVHLFSLNNDAAVLGIACLFRCAIPPLFPLIQAQTTYCIDVCDSANLIMTKVPESKKFFDRSRFITSRLPREPLQHALQFARQGGDYERALRGGSNAIRSSGRHRDQHCICFLSSPFDISVSGVV